MVEIMLLRPFLVYFNVTLWLMVTVLFLLKNGLKSARLLKFTNGLIILLLSLLLLQYGVYVYSRYIEPNWIKVEELKIKNHNFSTEVSNLKIVHISDLHIRKEGIREKLLVKKINALNPDVILVTGDFLTEREGIPAVLSVFSKLKSKQGIFGIFGDIDFHAFKKDEMACFKMQLEAAGVKILHNERAQIPIGNNKYLTLIAYTIPSKGDGFKTSKFESPRIVLIHSPNLVESSYISRDSCDLVLAGDTHGGQFGLQFIRNLSDNVSKFKYVSGLYYVKGVPLYVNRGIGTHRMNTRFLCRPEITVIKLEKGSE